MNDEKKKFTYPAVFHKNFGKIKVK